MTTISMLVVTAILEFIHLWFRRKKYSFTEIQFAVIFCTVIIVGIFGAVFSHYLETGYIGIRYYGTIFFVVVAFIPISALIKCKYDGIMNYVAPEGMIGIAVMKLNCISSGCCAGKTIYIASGDKYINFPSQVLEFVVAIIILIVLIRMERVEKQQKFMFAVFLILYSSTRFLFDGLREQQGRLLDLGFVDLSVGEIFCAIMIIMGFLDLKRKLSSKANNL